MKIYGVFWQSPLKEHSLLKVLYETRGTRGIVSNLYGGILAKISLIFSKRTLSQVFIGIR